ncbi:hypothetical protein [Aquimarina longa]|nr:hypothetical protein [Aquimarina longa]
MKKLVFALILLYAISFIYVGCSPEPLDQHDEKLLDKDEIQEGDI